MYLTEVSTIQREHAHVKLEFGNPIKTTYKAHKFGDNARAHLFAPDSIFALHLYKKNLYGTARTEIYICRALWPGEPGLIIPNVTPGAEILFLTWGVKNCNLVFRWFNNLKQADRDPADISPNDFTRAYFQFKARRIFPAGNSLVNLLKQANRRH